MSSLPWIIGGAAIGVGFLIYRSRQAAAGPAKPSTCESIAKLAGQDPAIVCGALGALGQIAGEVADALGKTSADVKRWDAKNKELNGEVDIPMDGFRKALANTCYDASSGNCYPFVDGTVLRFKNGCVPLSGSPDFAKCVAGTHRMDNYLPWQAWHFMPDSTNNGQTSYKPDAIRSMSGSVRLEGEPNDDRHPYDAFTRGGFKQGGLNHNPFPIPIPEGHLGYVYKGRPFTCPQGKPPNMRQIVRDHRGEPIGDAIPTCGGDAVGGWVPQPTQTNTGGGRVVIGSELGSTGTTVGGKSGYEPYQNPVESTQITNCADPGFILDTLPDGTRYCRRKRVGE